MGMDVYGLNPDKYFRNNVWWWRPLWDYVCNTCYDILSEKDMNAGSYNDYNFKCCVYAIYVFYVLFLKYQSDSNVLKSNVLSRPPPPNIGPSILVAGHAVCLKHWKRIGIKC